MSFANYLEHNGGHMLLLSDNTTAVSYVQKMGGVTSELHTKIVRDLWQEATDRNIWLSISYLPGIQNFATDFVLRVLSDRTEWELNAAIFRKICHNLAVNPSINLFASRLNHKLPTYSSFGPDPFCTYVDTFSFSWNEFDCVYAYPPFNLLCRTLAKIRQEGATALVICPAWPNQPWFPMMLSMLVKPPLLLYQRSRNTY